MKQDSQTGCALGHPEISLHGYYRLLIFLNRGHFVALEAGRINHWDIQLYFKSTMNPKFSMALTKPKSGTQSVFFLRVGY